LAALVAVLVTAPNAFAFNYVVNNPSATNDATAQNACSASLAGCTLPAAIFDSNATAGVADTITFTGAGTAPGPFVTADLPVISDPLVIDGGGTTTVTFDPAATGMLVDAHAASTTLKTITFTGGAAAATIVNLAGSGDRL